MNETVAAVDLGSNSFHMIVSRLNSNGELQVIDRIRESVRLAEGLDSSKTLQPQAIERALECLQRFGQRLAPLPAECVRVVGTNTLRRARNTRQFLEQTEKILGHSVDVISGAEEGRLIYAGVAPDIDPQLPRRLIMDIGGGSTEVISGQALKPVRIESFGLGCVSQTRRFFVDGAITTKAWKAAVTDASLLLEPHIQTYRRLGWDIAIGTSGTIRAIQQVLKAQGWSDVGINFKGLKQLRKALLAAGHVDRIAIEGLSQRRHAVIPGGLAVLWALFEQFRLEHIEVSDRALRDGLLYDLVGRLHDQDLRGRSVASMAARYDVDIHHAELVSTAAVELLAQLAPDWNLPLGTSRQLLRWAAYLHEIGLAITHNKYSRHSAYLIQHTDLEGFSQNQQRQLALIVHMHRGKLVPEMLQEIPERDRLITTRLIAILRLATLLHRGRNSERLPGFTATVDNDRINLKLETEWLQDHPLARADLKRECSYLKTIGVTLSLRKGAATSG